MPTTRTRPDRGLSPWATDRGSGACQGWAWIFLSPSTLLAALGAKSTRQWTLKNTSPFFRASTAWRRICTSPISPGATPSCRAAEAQKEASVSSRERRRAGIITRIMSISSKKPDRLEAAGQPILCYGVPVSLGATSVTWTLRS